MVSSVVDETRDAHEVFYRVERLEAVASTMHESDERRRTLAEAIASDLDHARPLRPRIAAALLGLSERTVRSWVAEGVLTRAEEAGSPRTLLDVRRVHEVKHLVDALRAAGRTRGLLDEVHRRLVDVTWLSHPDLVVSLDELRRGEGVVRVRE